MSSQLDVEGHVLYALRNATIKKWPFPHFFVENVWPEDFYLSLMAKLASKADFKGVKGKYSGRAFSNTEDFPELQFMNTPEFMREVGSIFHPYLKKRFEGREPNDCRVYHDLRLVRDSQGYSIGPHTDAAWKIVSLLFYLPAEPNWYQEHGTSIYLPKDGVMRCHGGPHYSFVPFKRIYTAPYVSNSCFGFFKTDNSFHGVEPIERDFRRDVLLYNLYDEKVYLDIHQQEKLSSEEKE